MEEELQKYVVFKGSTEGIKGLINPKGKWQEVFKNLKKIIVAKKGIFSSSNLILDLNGRGITAKSVEELKNYLKKLGFLNYSIENYKVKENQKKEKKNPEIIAGSIIKRDIKRNEIIKSTENLVIFGNIEEGAEIICSESLIVFGKVMGSIWAGFPKNNSSFVATIDLNETAKLAIGSSSYVDGFSFLSKDKKGRVFVNRNGLIQEEESMP